MKDFSLSLIYLIVGLASRTIFHIAPNLEFVTAISFGSVLFLENRFLKFAVPIVILILSDLIIGNSSIFIFTWSAFLVAPFFAKKLSNQNFKELIIQSEIRGTFFVVFFFLWTNFGVVLLTDMYEKSFAGLMQSYTNALPFLANQIIGNIFIIPVIIGFSFLFNNSFDHQHGEQLSPQS